MFSFILICFILQYFNNPVLCCQWYVQTSLTCQWQWGGNLLESIKQIAIIGGLSDRNQCGNRVEQIIMIHINQSSNVHPIHSANMHRHVENCNNWFKDNIFDSLKVYPIFLLTFHQLWGSMWKFQSLNCISCGSKIIIDPCLTGT